MDGTAHGSAAWLSHATCTSKASNKSHAAGTAPSGAPARRGWLPQQASGCATPPHLSSRPTVPSCTIRFALFLKLLPFSSLLAIGAFTVHVRKAFSPNEALCRHEAQSPGARYEATAAHRRKLERGQCSSGSERHKRARFASTQQQHKCRCFESTHDGRRTGTSSTCSTGPHSTRTSPTRD